MDDWIRFCDGVDEVVQPRRVDQLCSDQSGDEVGVLLPAGDELGDAQIVRFETTSPRVLDVGAVEDLDPIFPSRGQHCGRDLDALGVVPPLAVEL